MHLIFVISNEKIENATNLQENEKQILKPVYDSKKIGHIYLIKKMYSYIIYTNYHLKTRKRF